CLEPGSEPLVQLGSRRLREGVVGGVADQDVPKSEPVVPRELRPVWPDHLPTDERGQARSDLRLVGCESLDGSAMEQLSFDRAALQHPPLRGIELIETRGEQRTQVR